MKFHAFKLPRWLFFAAFIWTLVIVLSTVTFAAVSGSLPTGLSASNPTKFTWNVSENKISVTAETSSSTSCGSTKYSAQNETLTLTATSAGKLTVSVDSIEGSGEVKLNDTKVTATYGNTYTLEENDTLSIYISSGGDENTKSKTTLTLSISYTISGNSVTLNFQPVQNIPYEVNTQAVSSSTVVVSGDPADGFAVVADDPHYILTGATLEDGDGNISTVPAVAGKLSPTVSGKITPIFKYDQDADGIAPFLVGSTMYWDLNSAITAAGSSGTIILNDEYTLPADDYTIPSGVTLLIPFDSAGTCYTTSPGYEESSWSKPSAYRTLTMADGANIAVNGAISVSAKVSAKMGYAGAPTSSYGHVAMNAGSSITVNNGGNLYAWGYITGSGNVTIKSGASVYESFQVVDWRGGTASSGMLNNSSKVFPMTQYYIQNVEAPMTLESGASEKCSMVADIISVRQVTVSYLGTSGCMFNLTSGSVTKRYDGSADRLVLDINGEIAVSQTNIDLILTYTIKTQNYVLPINSNITMNVNSSGLLTFEQTTSLLPGVQINIAEGGTMSLSSGAKLFVYDEDEWKAGYYVYSNAYFRPVRYAYSQKYTRTNAADIIDAKIVVNGTLDASAGYLYTTTGGANICSTGNGVVKVQAPESSPSLYQATQSGTSISYVSVAVGAAQLKNGNDTYVATGTVGAGTYAYKDGFWHNSNCPGFDSEVTTPAKCESEGVMTYTCDCGNSYTETIAATGHDWNISYTWADDGSSCTATRVCGNDESHKETVTAEITSEVAKAATCTDVGNTKYIATFSDSWASNQEKIVEGNIDAKGHTKVPDAAVAPTYTQPGKTEGSHCDVCGEVILAQEEVPVLVFGFTAANVNMGNSLNMRFAFPKDGADELNGSYVEIVRTYADDGKTVDGVVIEKPEAHVVRISKADWVIDNGFYVVSYSGLAAKEMCDTITLTLYDAAGNAIGKSWVDSMRDYAMRIIKTSQIPEQKNLAVDFLNYGAAAQLHFGYDTKHLANALLTDEMKALASDDKEYTDNYTANRDMNYYFGSNLTLESNILFKIALRNLPEDAIAKVSFTNHYGNPVSKDYTFVEDGSYKIVVIDLLVVADARQPITVTTTGSDGSKIVITDSIEAYLARRNSSDIEKAVMKFADSAYAYLHRDDPAKENAA